MDHICPMLNSSTETAQEINWMNMPKHSIYEYIRYLHSTYLCLTYIIYFASILVQAREPISEKRFVFPFLWLHWRQRRAGGTHTLLCISTAVHQSESHSQLIKALCNLCNVQLLVIFSPFQHIIAPSLLYHRFNKILFSSIQVLLLKYNYSNYIEEGYELKKCTKPYFEMR